MPGIKHIQIPGPIAIFNHLVEPGERKPLLTEDGQAFVVSFRRFIFPVLEHETFRKSREAFKSATTIADLVESAKPGQVVAVAGDDLTRLLKASEDVTTFGWASWILRQLQPFFAALEDAKDRAEDFAPPPAPAPAAPAAALPLPNGESKSTEVAAA